VVAPDVGGGFGSKIFIYPEEMVALWASKKVRRPVKWTGDRTEAFLTDAHGRDHLTKAEMAFDAGQQDHRAAREDLRQSRCLHVAVLVLGADLPVCDAAVGQYNIPNIFAEVISVYNQHHPGRCLPRRRPARSKLCGSNA